MLVFFFLYFLPACPALPIAFSSFFFLHYRFLGFLFCSSVSPFCLSSSSYRLLFLHFPTLYRFLCCLPPNLPSLSHFSFCPSLYPFTPFLPWSPMSLPLCHPFLTFSPTFRFVFLSPPLLFLLFFYFSFAYFPSLLHAVNLLFFFHSFLAFSLTFRFVFLSSPLSSFSFSLLFHCLLSSLRLPPLHLLILVILTFPLASLPFPLLPCFP